MFDIASWKLLLLAAIALIVVGPKDLPVMLRMLGRYLGMIRRQAAEFRAQGFEQAQRIKAAADREATVIRAEAEREAEILRGEGEGESAS